MNQRGISFIEVTLALVILSVGLVGIFKTFIISLDRIQHLNNRLIATHTLDNRLIQLEKTLRAYHAIPFDFSKEASDPFVRQGLDFQEDMEIKQLDGFSNIFVCRFSLEWKERAAKKTMNRMTYLMDPGGE